MKLKKCNKCEKEMIEHIFFRPSGRPKKDGTPSGTFRGDCRICQNKRCRDRFRNNAAIREEQNARMVERYKVDTEHREKLKERSLERYRLLNH